LNVNARGGEFWKREIPNEKMNARSKSVLNDGRDVGRKLGIILPSFAEGS